MPFELFKNFQRGQENAQDELNENFVEIENQLNKQYEYPEPTKENIEAFFMDKSIKQGNFQWNGPLLLKDVLNYFFLNIPTSTMTTNVTRLSKKMGVGSNPNDLHIIIELGVGSYHGRYDSESEAYRLSRINCLGESWVSSFDDLRFGSSVFKYDPSYLPLMVLGAQSVALASLIDTYILSSNQSVQIRTSYSTGERTRRVYNGTTWSNWAPV